MRIWGGIMELLRSLTISDLEPFLADPTHLNTQPVALQLAVASYSPTPRPLLEVLVNSPHAPVAEAAQLHINWAGEISEDGQNAVEEVLKSRYLGQNDKLAVELLKIAPVPPLFFSEWVPSQYLIQALSNPYLPLRYHLKLLERLAKEPTLEPRLQVAESPEAPLAILESLAGDLELAIRLAVQHNPVSPPELVRLVQGQHEIASDCDTNAEQLANLAQSRWDWIRLAVAQNPSTPEETLLALAEDKVFKIRFAVAKNSVASAQVLAVLAESDQEIQAVVAGHDNATEEILERLAQYPNAKVQLAARRKPESNIDLIIQQRATPGEIIEKIVDRADNRQKKEIAKHPNVSSNTLEKLAEDSSSRVRLAVAQSFYISSSLREKLLEELATDEFETVRAAVAGWSKTPLHLIQQIGSDTLSKSEPDILVCAALIGNFKTPIDLKSTIIEYFNLLNLDYDRNLELCIALKINEDIPIMQEDKRRDLLYKIKSRDIDTIARDLHSPIYLLEQIAALGTQNAHLAKNPATPPEILVQLARQPVEKTINNVKPVVVRQIVLNNPGLPTLERYRLLVAQEQEQEIAQATQLLANRPNSSYALAQVLETGDQNAKITVACSNKTPITILERLAKDSDPTIRQVVSRNPNLPLSILFDLTQDENLNVRLNLVRYRSNQIEILERLAQDESDWVRAEVAGNKNTPVEILTQLAHNSSRSVCEKLTGNQNTPVEVLEFLGVEKKLANAYNRKTPGNALAAVVEDTLKNSYSQEKVFEYLLRNLEGSQMPASTLEKLATNTTSWIRSDVAHHRNTPLSALEKMIDDTYEPVLWGIAGNPNSSPQLLERLLNKHYEEVAGGIAGRNEIPVNLMERLLENKSQYVRQPVASSHNLPPELMAKIIATEPEEPVLISLARNPNLTSELLTQFIQHSNSNVRTALVRHPNLTEVHWQQLAQDKALPVREVVAASGNVPAQVLELLSRDEKVEVRLKVVTNSRTPESALVPLARDEDLTIRAAVATNPNLPSPQLEQLAQDEKVEVRRAVAQNPNTPAAVRASLQDLVIQPTARQTQTSPTLRGLSRLYNPQTDDLARVLSEYAESDVPFVRFVTLLHPLTPVEVLQQGAQSASWLERYAVADNPATPTEIKQQLTEDGNQIVRAVAMASLA
ncbi:hypothetical protein [Nostoc sp. JL33]|uniref:hypothetical protein n=1 Tax=Nostoc sp. JL33 TaxID=2815396 RepID=UPI0025FB7928|nr:hypothetical protein [Nostoc sp. JL33]MBN3869644.1 hypothetical protein [Nostoc sp. JL33]